MRSWSALKLAISAVSFVAFVVWLLWVGNGLSVAGWVVVLVAIPLAPLLATAIPPAKGNAYLIAMASFGLVFSIVPVVVDDDDMIQGYSMLFLGLVGCVVSWILLARRYCVDWRTSKVPDKHLELG